MVENGKPAVTKVVTANKLLPSVLHGLAPLIPSALNSAKAKEDPGKVLLLESIEDDAPWYSYIKVGTSSFDNVHYGSVLVVTQLCIWSLNSVPRHPDCLHVYTGMLTSGALILRYLTLATSGLS